MADMNGQVLAAREALYSGQPRAFLEEFTVIRLEDATIRRLGSLRGNQAYYYGESFGKLRSWRDAMPDIVVLKARGALSSTLWVDAMGAYASQVPNWKAAIVANHHKVTGALMEMVETAWAGYPIEAKVGTTLTINNAEQKEWGHGAPSAGGVYPMVSSIQAFSGEGIKALRGQRFNMVLVSELGPMEEFAADIVAEAGQAGRSVGTWWVTESTPYREQYPSGKKNLFFMRCEAARRQETPDVLLIREWYRNPLRWLPWGSVRAAPADKGALVYTAEEQAVVAQFPLDGVDAEGRIRWRRTEIAAMTRDKGGNPRAGKAAFLQEHVESYDTCWRGDAGGRLSEEVALRMKAQCERPYFDEAALGIRKRLWKPYVPGHVYILTQDSAKGTVQGDDSVALLFDHTTGMCVAEFYGRRISGEALQDAAIPLGQEFRAWYVPETNGLGYNLPERARKRGYERVWKEPMRAAETMQHYLDRDAGYLTGRDKREAGGRLIGALTEGEIGTYCADHVNMLDRYDWENKAEHTPDAAICFMIFNEVRGYLAKGEWSSSETQHQAARRQPVLAPGPSGPGHVVGVATRF